MEHLNCHNCGILFGAPDAWVAERRADTRVFYCPNGHSAVFKESTATKLQRRIDEMKQQAASAEQALQARLNEARHAGLVAEKALASETRKRRRIEKRVAAGVCPCCNRTFEDLHRHMQTKHKDYALAPGHALQIAAGHAQAATRVVESAQKAGLT